MAEHTAIAVEPSQSLIRNTPFETALQKQRTNQRGNHIQYLKNLYLRNLLMFIEEELGLKQGYAHYTAFIGSYNEIQTRNLLAYCEGDKNLFDFVSHMESMLLRRAQKRVDKINWMRKLLFFLPVLGWVKIMMQSKELAIGIYNRRAVSTLKIKQELKGHGVDTKEVISDIVSHNTSSYEIYDWVDWD